MKHDPKEAAASLVKDAEGSVKIGDLTQASESFKKALAIDPSHYIAAMGAGFCAFRMGDLAAACHLYQHATTLRPRAPEAHHNLGEALLLLRLLDRAEDHFRQAIRASDRFVPALAGLGRVYRYRGSFDAAIAQFEKALKLDPNNLASLIEIANSRNCEKGDPHLGQLGRLLDSGKLSKPDQASAHFALGKALNDQKQYERAFEHFQQARLLKENHFPRELHRQFVEELITSFDSDFFQTRNHWGYRGDITPVFVLGVPRSGTSLVEQMLASHPKVHGADELMLLRGVISQLERALGTRERQYPVVVQDMDASQAELAGKRYCQGLAPLANSRPYVVDKMPANYFQIGFIHLTMPGAGIIHCERSLYDIALSCFSTNFSAEHAFLENLPALGYYLRCYARLMHHWDKVLPGRVHHVNYEELVADPEPRLRALFEYLEIEWDDRCLSFHKQKSTVMTASTWQVRQPLYQSSSRRWKRFEKQLEPLFAELPYENWRDYPADDDLTGSL